MLGDCHDPLAKGRRSTRLQRSHVTPGETDRRQGIRAPDPPAVGLQTREELTRVWRKRGTELGLGIGIEAGYATIGRIGFEGRYDYAALGSVTNLASRLSTHASAGQILVGPRVFAAVEEKVNTKAVGSLDLKGFGRPIPAYEVQGLLT